MSTENKDGAGSAAERVVKEWRLILHGDGPPNYGASIYHTTPGLRDALTELARLLPNAQPDSRE